MHVLFLNIVFLDQGKNKMTGLELIAQVENLVNENLEFVQKKCQHFSEEQINWRPSSNEWSIAHVFAHLNKYANYHHPAVTKKSETTKFRTPTENFISSPLGRASWKSMKLGRAKNIKRKFKAPPGYNPVNNPELVDGNEVENFIKQQTELLSILDAAKSINIRKAKVSISLSRIIKFRMGDAFMFVVNHDERHIEQIKKLMNHPNFPKKK